MPNGQSPHLRRLAIAAAFCACLGAAAHAGADPNDLHARIDTSAAAVEGDVIADRRHFHEHPELGNREFETSKYVAKKLKALGWEVKTGVAKTGVVAVLRGGRPGRTLALRADMDALPVVEEVDVPFASHVKTTYDGQAVGVMHACGHDAHMGILLGVAKVLAGLKADLPGNVKLLFQPAEEGAPDGEEGGAALMVKEGVMRDDPKPEVVFGLHVFSSFDTGTIAVRPGGAFASADDLTITVQGRQTHGAYPWRGVDPITVAAQIILALQTIPSRQMDLTKAPTLVTIGRIDGGTRGNIIPDRVVMKGTIRAYDKDMQHDLHERIRRTATDIAASAGAAATVDIAAGTAYPVTWNDPALTAQMMPTLQRVAGSGKVVEAPRQMGAEDFSFFAQEVPGLFFIVGIRKPGGTEDEYPSNHSPRFRVDEDGLLLGVRALANVAVDYLVNAAP